MHTDRFEPAGEIAAEHAGELGHGKIEERSETAFFQLRRAIAAEVAFDDRPAERPQMIARRPHPIGATINANARIEFFRTGERNEKLVVDAQGQAARGFNLLRQRRRKADPLSREHRSRHRHDHLIGGNGAFARLNAQPLAAVVDGTDRTIQHLRQRRAVLAYERAVAFDGAPIDVGRVVAVQIFQRYPIKRGAANISARRIDKWIPARRRIEQVDAGASPPRRAASCRRS